MWMTEFCTTNPQVASSRVQRELKGRFGVAVSVSQINRVRAKSGVSHQWRARAQGKGKKTAEWQTSLEMSEKCPLCHL
jgi:Mg-chelatase subunit ChlI